MIKKKIRNKRCLFAFILSASLMFLSVLSTSAASSPYTTNTALGITYRFNSSVYNNSSSTWGYTGVTSQQRYGVGYVGINARLYNSAGTLVKSSGWKYNSEPLYGHDENSGSTTVRGTYYSKGQVNLYNGNGYTTYTSNASPNISRSVSGIVNKDFEINALGLTYGSDYYSTSTEDTPDLIRVLGINNIEGYVYAADLENNLNTLDEVIQFINSEPSDYTIPVYDENGQNVIDQFLITY